MAARWRRKSSTVAPPTTPHPTMAIPILLSIPAPFDGPKNEKAAEVSLGGLNEGF
jgi:hypothetical protein